jgi:membrane-associated phospholipid phosphatase
MWAFFYWIIFSIVSVTRMFRGLHYPHDIFFSYMYAYYVAVLVNCF